MAYKSSIFGSRKQNARRRKSRGRRRQGGTSIPFLPILGGVSVAALLGGLGYITVQDMNTVKPDALGCYAQSSPQDSTTVFVDSSDPGFDPVQSRDLIRAFENTYQRDLRFNERFSIVTTQESRIGTIPDPVIELCGTAKSSADLENVGAAGATQAFLTRQSDKIFEKTLKPTLNKVFAVNPAASDRQSRESPILEQIQNLSRLPEMSKNANRKHLIVVSDMLQNTREMQFCSTKGDLPRFQKFKQTPGFARIKPASLNGVDVTIYMLIRGTLGTPPFAFCTEDELTHWWRDYFEDAGANSVNLIRVRHGG